MTNFFRAPEAFKPPVGPPTLLHRAPTIHVSDVGARLRHREKCARPIPHRECWTRQAPLRAKFSADLNNDASMGRATALPRHLSHVSPQRLSLFVLGDQHRCIRMTSRNGASPCEIRVSFHQLRLSPAEPADYSHGRNTAVPVSLALKPGGLFFSLSNHALRDLFSVVSRVEVFRRKRRPRRAFAD